MATKIAIIEDNPDNLELMVYLLEQFGYELVTAIDGEEGIKLIEREKPQLIICDIQLPKLNGYQIANKLKTNKLLASIPLIAVTAYSMVGDRDKILASGYDDYISKPIEPEFFVKQIQRHLPMHEPTNHPISTLPQEQANSNCSDIKSNRSILIVDDSSDNRELMDVLLKLSGFNTILSDTVEHALIELEKERPDFIISDLHLPGMNGLEFIRMLKKKELFRHIPVVILSASTPSVKEREECIALGVLSFITRPIEAEDFITMIDELYKSNVAKS